MGDEGDEGDGFADHRLRTRARERPGRCCRVTWVGAKPRATLRFARCPLGAGEAVGHQDAEVCGRGRSWRWDRSIRTAVNTPIITNRASRTREAVEPECLCRFRQSKQSMGLMQAPALMKYSEDH
jgi:hypothetical protein